MDKEECKKNTAERILVGRLLEVIEESDVSFGTARNSVNTLKVLLDDMWNSFATACGCKTVLAQNANDFRVARYRNSDEAQ